MGKSSFLLFFCLPTYEMKRIANFSVTNPSKFPFFYGYVIAFVGTIGLWASFPGQTVGVSVFTDPVKDALGLSRNQFSNAYLIGTFMSALLIGKSGKLLDVLGTRLVSFLACILLGTALLLAAVSVEISNFFEAVFSSNSWVIPFTVISCLFFLIRFSGQGLLTMASRNMVMIWFDRNRGKVNSFMSIAVSLGFSLSPLLINVLIDHGGWEYAWQFLAFGIFVMSIFVWQFYRNKPEDHGLVPDGFLKNESAIGSKKIKEEVSFTLSEVTKTRSFWMYGLILAFNAFFVTGFSFHIVSIFGTIGVEKSAAVAVFFPISLVSVIVSLVFNIWSDYLKLQWQLYGMILAGIIGALGLYYLSLPFGKYLLIVGLGALGGFFAVLNAIVWPRFYGRKHLGAITGKVMSFIIVSSAIAPSLFSFFFSYFGTYKYIGLICLLFLIFLLVGSRNAVDPRG